MRKTLTVICIVIAGASLAACKMFWEHEEKPPAVATASAATDPTAADPTTTAEASKPTDQTTAMSGDKPASGEKTEAPTLPAKK